MAYYADRGGSAANASMAEQYGFRVGDCTVDPGRGRVIRPDGAARLEPRAMELLRALAERAGRVVSRDELIDAVWGHPHVGDDAVFRCMTLVRQALGDDRASPRYLETVPRRGYRLIAAVSGIGAAPVGARMHQIAVLPFVNLTGDEAKEYVADGMTELLITWLACLPALRVTSRTSSMHYKHADAPIAQIARELGVTHVVQGSVLRFDHDLELSVRVVETAGGSLVLEHRGRQSATDLLRMQNEMAWTIASEIQASLDPRDRERMPKAPPVPEHAMQSYLLARHFWAQRTPDAFPKAIREYEACIAAAPDFAAALAGLSLTHSITAFYGVMPASAVVDAARRSAERAHALDEGSAEALCAMGAVRMIFDWDFAAAESYCRRAVDANPSYDIARLALGDCLVFRHDFDGGLRELHAGARMGPFDAGLQLNIGDFLVFARRFDAARDHLRKVVETMPYFWPARCKLAEAFAWLGAAEEARSQLARAREDIPVAALHQPEIVVLALLGEKRAARQLLAALEAARAQHYVAPWTLARGYAILGDVEAAFHWIEAGIAERSPLFLGLGIFPDFDTLRPDPRFAACLERIGLPG